MKFSPLKTVIETKPTGCSDQVPGLELFDLTRKISHSTLFFSFPSFTAQAGVAKSGWAWPILPPGSGYIRQLQVKHCLAPNSHTFNTTPAYKNLPDKAWPAQTVVTEQLRQLIPGEWLAVCACLPVCGRGQARVPRLQPALMSFCPTRSRRPWLLLPSGFTSSVRDFTSSGRGGVLTAPWAAVGTWRRAKAALPKSGDSWQKQCMRGFLTWPWLFVFHPSGRCRFFMLLPYASTSTKQKWAGISFSSLLPPALISMATHCEAGFHRARAQPYHHPLREAEGNSHPRYCVNAHIVCLQLSLDWRRSEQNKKETIKYLTVMISCLNILRWLNAFISCEC